MKKDEVANLVQELTQLRDMAADVARKADGLLKQLHHPVDSILIAMLKQDVVPDQEKECRNLLHYLVRNVANGTYKGRHALERAGNDGACLVVRLSDLTDEFYGDANPVVSTRSFKVWLHEQGLLTARGNRHIEVERSINHQRVPHMVCVILDRARDRLGTRP